MLSASVDLDVNVTADDVTGAYREAIKDVADLGFAVSQEKAPFDRGDLKQSGFPPEFRGDDLFFGYTAPYAEAMEKGTGPFTPPLRPLLEWGDRTFSTERSADEVLADLEENGWHPGIFSHPGAAVWSKIRSEGIDPHPYLAPAAERMRGRLQTLEIDY